MQTISERNPACTDRQRIAFWQQLGKGSGVRTGAENNVAEADGDITANRSAATLADGFIESFERRYPRSILETLLADRTTGKNIIWADGEYEQLGEGYAAEDEITCEAIAGTNSGVIKPRVLKEQERQSKRTKARAEVFTPSWLVNEMANALDEDWFRHKDTFTEERGNSWEPNLNRIEFPKSKGRGWHDYVSSTRLEITCGEAPFLCSRYDTVTGEALPVSRRIGVLDRKLRVVSERVRTYRNWAQWTLVALKSTYGYEYQGDNLLIARINCLETFVEHCIDRWGVPPKPEDVRDAAWVISWNLWQMNGLTCAVPTTKLDAPIQSTLYDYAVPEQEPAQMTLFDIPEESDGNERETIDGSSELANGTPLCVIYDWENDQPVEFSSMKGEVSREMKKFYAVIGNPPYQISDGGAQRSAVPIYHKFIEQAKKLQPEVLSMIVPARWYAGGRGLDDFRREMLADTHLSQLHDFPETGDVFPGMNIRGGVCYFLWQNSHKGKCEVINHFKGETFTSSRYLLDDDGEFFVRWNKGMGIINKVKAFHEDSFSVLVSASKPFGLRAAFNDFSSICDKNHAIKLYRFGSDGYIDGRQIPKGKEFIDEWKVIVPEASPGTDEYPHLVLSKPIISEPNSICTETYLMIGPFGNKEICSNVCSYIETRFFRFLVLMLKNTQHTTRRVYQYVPIQDFTHKWTDEELFDKYRLADDEINFIYKLVKER